MERSPESHNGTQNGAQPEGIRAVNGRAQEAVDMADDARKREFTQHLLEGQRASREARAAVVVYRAR